MNPNFGKGSTVGPDNFKIEAEAIDLNARCKILSIQ
jgi:hypothetical protein